MENLLTYILQVNLLLVLIFLGYYFLLKGLTFYALNRVYFIVGSLYAFAYPFIDIKSWFTKTEVLQSTFLPELLPSFEMPVVSSNQITLLDVIIAVVAILAVLFVVKLLIQLFSLLRIHLHSKNSSWQSYIFRNVVFPVVPFSFFNNIYIHKQQHQETELQDIFAHEIVHVRGHHTVDILLFEIILVVCWYNPFVWLMRKAVRQNLEFLTDQQVLNKGVDKQTYQYSLLHVTRQGVAVGMSNHFNFKTLKKRIMMMNKKRSSKLELSKYAFLLPVFLIAGMSFTVSKAENNIDKIVEKSQQTTVISEPLKVKMQGEVGELLKNTIGTDVIAIDTNNQEKEYPLLAPDFDRKELEGKNLHFEIDGKLVSLDEFLEFPRKEIYGVDIYKDKEEIRKKIGKENSEGYFVITSKNKKPVKIQIDIKRLKSKSEIDSKKKFIYEYDGKILSEKEFLAIADENLKGLTQTISESQVKAQYSKLVSNWGDYDGIVRALSAEGVTKQKENTKKVLFVIDGVEQSIGSDLEDLDPNNIESMNVLKGQSATAIYGDKGKDGVIMITTKKSQKNAVVVKGYKTANDTQDIKTDRLIDPVTVIGYSTKKGDASTEIEPMPEGGLSQFRKWIGDNYNYPKDAIDAGVKGTVLVSFIVETDGSLTDIKIMRDLGYGTGEAAINSFKKSPKWIPGMKDGKPIKRSYVMPINLSVMNK